MLIVGENLKQLIQQFGIVEDEECFDNTSISLRLHRDIIRLSRPEGEEEAVITYGDEIPEKFIDKGKIPQDGIVIPPKSCILACSYEKVSIPVGYFGFLQTKGSLARLFVSLTCTDGQVDPGFTGNITYEICNLSDFSVKLKYRQKVGQLFIFKASTNNVQAYNGRYQNADGPTIFLPE
nr:hypothetical protein [Paenibacillus xylanexedens]